MSVIHIKVLSFLILYYFIPLSSRNARMIIGFLVEPLNSEDIWTHTEV